MAMAIVIASSVGAGAPKEAWASFFVLPPLTLVSI